MKTPNEAAEACYKQRAQYLDVNDFESALRTRDDRGAIYNNKVIMGWLEDTYELAFKEGAQWMRANDPMVLELLGALQKIDEALRPHRFTSGLPEHLKWDIYQLAADAIAKFKAGV